MGPDASSDKGKVESVISLAPLSSRPITDLPVALLNRPQNVGTIVLNTYFKHFLGPRTFGRTLNVGAGDASVTYRQREYFAASEYHTLESVESAIPATYQCSATRMDQIPDASYDWVVSTSVLEHVDDCWAAAREQIRIAKPGGFIYCLIPFDQVLHPAAYFGDFWRFTPQGLRKLFEGCDALEIEAWGDNPTQPNGFAILFRKPPNPAPTPQPKCYWFEFPNEDPFGVHIIRDSFRYDWTMHELLVEPMNLALQVNNIWNQLGGGQELVVPQASVARRFKYQYSRPMGRLSIRGEQAKFTPE